MNEYEVKISSKNQVVVPREIRDALRVGAGDELIFILRGKTAIVMPKPDKYSSAIAGIAENIYSLEYLKGERESWK